MDALVQRYFIGDVGCGDRCLLVVPPVTAAIVLALHALASDTVLSFGDRVLYVSQV